MIMVITLKKYLKVKFKHFPAFSNQYTSGKSFDELEEKKVDENTEKGIRFSVDFKLHPDAVKKFDSVGQQIRSNCCVVQHNLVMHSFVYSLAVVKDCKQEGSNFIR